MNRILSVIAKLMFLATALHYSVVYKIEFTLTNALAFFFVCFSGMVFINIVRDTLEPRNQEPEL